MTTLTSADTRDVTDIALALEREQLSPVGLFEEYLDRIERLDGKLSAFVHVFREDGRAAARAADMARRAGHCIGPLHGIPIAFKDIIDIKGHPTRLGSAASRSAVPASASAHVVEAAICAGMIALGKTSTVEYAFGGWGTDPQGNAPWNPWDTAVHRIPGGSSSGSAVAVSAGLAPVAIGSDTSGSIRVPASFCGIVGLKTTTTSVNRRGVLELSPSLDTVGPLVRSVRDAELMLALFTGADAAGVRAVLKQGSARPSSTFAGMRIAVAGDRERAGVSDDVLANFDASIRAFEKLGAVVETLDALPAFGGLGALTKTILMAESFALHGGLANDPHGGMGEVVARKIRSGAGISASTYLRAMAERAELQARYFSMLSGYDALLTPATETVAIPVAEVDEGGTPARLVRLANLVDCFALSVPNGLDRCGLPTGLQIMAAEHSAQRIFAIGKIYQAAVDWQGSRVPSV